MRGGGGGGAFGAFGGAVVVEDGGARERAGAGGGGGGAFLLGDFAAVGFFDGLGGGGFVAAEAGAEARALREGAAGREPDWGGEGRVWVRFGGGGLRVTPRRREGVERFMVGGVVVVWMVDGGSFRGMSLKRREGGRAMECRSRVLAVPEAMTSCLSHLPQASSTHTSPHAALPLPPHSNTLHVDDLPPA